MKYFKRFLYSVVLLLIALMAYVYFVNRNSPDMTIRQKLLKAFYPVLVWASGKKAKQFGNEHAKANVPFYSLKATANNGTEFDFTQLKGKKVLLVNTASDCGYTGQYDDLQKLYEKYQNRLVILGFPANDFKEQEKGSDEDIAQFCKINFGVTFPLMKKSTVIKSAEQNAVFKWLSDSTMNGWNNKQPSWNFSKYLINEEGQLVHYFDPAVSPLSNEVISAIEKQ
jgi:glutathione peroxidase